MNLKIRNTKMCTWVGSLCEGVGGGSAQRQTISSCPDSSQWTAASEVEQQKKYTNIFCNFEKYSLKL